MNLSKNPVRDNSPENFYKELQIQGGLSELLENVRAQLFNPEKTTEFQTIERQRKAQEQLKKIPFFQKGGITGGTVPDINAIEFEQYMKFQKGMRNNHYPELEILYAFSILNQRKLMLFTRNEAGKYVQSRGHKVPSVGEALNTPVVNLVVSEKNGRAVFTLLPRESRTLPESTVPEPTVPTKMGSSSVKGSVADNIGVNKHIREQVAQKRRTLNYPMPPISESVKSLTEEDLAKGNAFYDAIGTKDLSTLLQELQAVLATRYAVEICVSPPERKNRKENTLYVFVSQMNRDKGQLRFVMKGKDSTHLSLDMEVEKKLRNLWARANTTGQIDPIEVNDRNEIIGAATKGQYIQGHPRLDSILASIGKISFRGEALNPHNFSGYVSACLDRKNGYPALEILFAYGALKNIRFSFWENVGKEIKTEPYASPYVLGNCEAEDYLSRRRAGISQISAPLNSMREVKLLVNRDGVSPPFQLLPSEALMTKALPREPKKSVVETAVTSYIAPVLPPLPPESHSSEAKEAVFSPRKVDDSVVSPESLLNPVGYTTKPRFVFTSSGKDDSSDFLTGELSALTEWSKTNNIPRASPTTPPQSIFLSGVPKKEPRDFGKTTIELSKKNAQESGSIGGSSGSRDINASGTLPSRYTATVLPLPKKVKKINSNQKGNESASATTLEDLSARLVACLGMLTKDENFQALKAGMPLMDQKLVYTYARVGEEEFKVFFNEVQNEQDSLNRQYSRLLDELEVALNEHLTPDSSDSSAELLKSRETEVKRIETQVHSLKDSADEWRKNKNIFDTEFQWCNCFGDCFDQLVDMLSETKEMGQNLQKSLGQVAQKEKTIQGPSEFLIPELLDLCEQIYPEIQRVSLAIKTKKEKLKDILLDKGQRMLASEIQVLIKEILSTQEQEMESLRIELLSFENYKAKQLSPKKKMKREKGMYGKTLTTEVLGRNTEYYEDGFSPESSTIAVPPEESTEEKTPGPVAPIKKKVNLAKKVERDFEENVLRLSEVARLANDLVIFVKDKIKEGKYFEDFIRLIKSKISLSEQNSEQNKGALIGLHTEIAEFLQGINGDESVEQSQRDFAGQILAAIRALEFGTHNNIHIHFSLRVLTVAGNALRTQIDSLMLPPEIVPATIERKPLGNIFDDSADSKTNVSQYKPARTTEEKSESAPRGSTIASPIMDGDPTLAADTKQPLLLNVYSPSYDSRDEKLYFPLEHESSVFRRKELEEEKDDIEDAVYKPFNPSSSSTAAEPPVIGLEYIYHATHSTKEIKGGVFYDYNPLRRDNERFPERKTSNTGRRNRANDGVSAINCLKIAAGLCSVAAGGLLEAVMGRAAYIFLSLARREIDFQERNRDRKNSGDADEFHNIYPDSSSTKDEELVFQSNPLRTGKDLMSENEEVIIRFEESVDHKEEKEVTQQKRGHDVVNEKDKGDAGNIADIYQTSGDYFSGGRYGNVHSLSSVNDPKQKKPVIGVGSRLKIACDLGRACVGNSAMFVVGLVLTVPAFLFNLGDNKEHRPRASMASPDVDFAFDAVEHQSKKHLSPMRKIEETEEEKEDDDSVSDNVINVINGGDKSLLVKKKQEEVTLHDEVVSESDFIVLENQNRKDSFSVNEAAYLNGVQEQGVSAGNCLKIACGVSLLCISPICLPFLAASYFLSWAKNQITSAKNLNKKVEDQYDESLSLGNVAPQGLSNHLSSSQYDLDSMSDITESDTEELDWDSLDELEQLELSGRALETQLFLGIQKSVKKLTTDAKFVLSNKVFARHCFDNKQTEGEENKKAIFTMLREVSEIFNGECTEDTVKLARALDQNISALLSYIRHKEEELEKAKIILQNSKKIIDSQPAEEKKYKGIWRKKNEQYQKLRAYWERKYGDLMENIDTTKGVDEDLLKQQYYDITRMGDLNKVAPFVQKLMTQIRLVLDHKVTIDLQESDVSSLRSTVIGPDQWESASVSLDSTFVPDWIPPEESGRYILGDRKSAESRLVGSNQRKVYYDVAKEGGRDRLKAAYTAVDDVSVEGIFNGDEKKPEDRKSHANMALESAIHELSLLIADNDYKWPDAKHKVRIEKVNDVTYLYVMGALLALGVDFDAIEVDRGKSYLSKYRLQLLDKPPYTEEATPSNPLVEVNLNDRHAFFVKDFLDNLLGHKGASTNQAIKMPRQLPQIVQAREEIKKRVNAIKKKREALKKDHSTVVGKKIQKTNKYVSVKTGFKNRGLRSMLLP